MYVSRIDSSDLVVESRSKEDDSNDLYMLVIRTGPVMRESGKNELDRS